MRYLTSTLLAEPDAALTIRATAPGHVFVRLVREGEDDLIFEGADVEEALVRLDWELEAEALDEFGVPS